MQNPTSPHLSISYIFTQIYPAIFSAGPLLIFFPRHATTVAEDGSDHDEDDDAMDDGPNEGPGDRFASLLAQLAGPRLHAAMGGGGGGGSYDRLLKGLGSSKSYEQQGALEEISQVGCASGRIRRRETGVVTAIV